MIFQKCWKIKVICLHLSAQFHCMASDDLKGKRSILWGGALRNGTAERREGGQASCRNSHQGKQLCFLQDMGKGKLPPLVWRHQDQQGTWTVFEIQRIKSTVRSKTIALLQQRRDFLPNSVAEHQFSFKKMQITVGKRLQLVSQIIENQMLLEHHLKPYQI